jgi:hypothetical protein
MSGLILACGATLAFLGGPALAVDFLPGACTYEEDFSSDPGWVTNDPANFYWDPGAQAYHGKQIDCQNQYAYRLLECDYCDGSFRLEFDVNPTVDWAGNINIGLVDPTMHTIWCEGATIHIAFSMDDDNFRRVQMITTDDDGVCRGTDWWAQFPEHGVWYRCLVTYDQPSHSAYFKVTRQSTGEIVAEETLTGLGDFTRLDRIAWSGVGDMGYCGHWGEGLLDNVRLEYEGCPTGCEGHEVTAVCPGELKDVLCHFEGDFCGAPFGDAALCAGSWGQGFCSNGNGGVNLGNDGHYSQADIEIEFQVMLDRVPVPGDNAEALVTKYRGHNASLSEWGVFVEKSWANPSVPVWMLCGDGTLCIQSSPSQPVQTGVLYCVKTVLDGSYGEIWVNGSLVASGPVARNPGKTATPVMIGYAEGHPNWFDGMIDEVRLGCFPPISSVAASWGSVKSLFR